MLVYLELQHHHEKSMYNGSRRNRKTLNEVEYVVKMPLETGDAGTRDLLQVCLSLPVLRQKQEEELAFNLTLLPRLPALEP